MDNFLSQVEKLIKLLDEQEKLFIDGIELSRKCEINKREIKELLDNITKQ